MGEEEDEHDSPVEGQPEKVKKPKKVYCYISPKVRASIQWLSLSIVIFLHQIKRYFFAIMYDEVDLDFYVNSNYP